MTTLARPPATAPLPPGPTFPRWLQTLGFMVGGVRYLEWCRRRYGDVITMGTLFDKRFVMLFDPGAVKELFQGSHDGLHAGEANALLGPIVGQRSGYEYPAAMLPGTFLWFVPGMLLAVWSAAEEHVPGLRGPALLLRPANGTAAWGVALVAFATVCVLGAVDAPRYLADDLVVPVLTLCLLAPAVAGREVVAGRSRTLPQALLGTRPLLARS